MEDFTRTVLARVAVPTFIAGVVASVVAAFVGGAPAAVGAILGTAIVLIFFIVGQLFLAMVLRNNPELALSAALVIYLTKIGVLMLLLFLLQGTTAFDTRAFGFTIILCTLVWTIAEVWILAKTKALVVDPNNVPEGAQRMADNAPNADQ